MATTKKPEEERSVFEILNAINVNDHVEKKKAGDTTLTYLSWAWAWAEVKKAFPDASFTIYERDTEFGPVNYFTDGKTCWVKTGVTINGLEHIEELPVMNYANKSIPLNAVTSFDVNKSIQRSLTKAAARHGLGLYIYAGEDLPEEPPEAPVTKLKAVEVKQEKPEPKAEEVKEEAKDATEILPLNEVIDEIAKIVQPKAAMMDDDGKKRLIDWMTERIGVRNYKKCTDVEKLNVLLADLRKLEKKNAA